LYRPSGNSLTGSDRHGAEHSIDQVRAGQPFRSSGEDTLADVQLFEAIHRAHLQRQGVA
jgi:hypothetical protein